jgi:hypothetical protein
MSGIFNPSALPDLPGVYTDYEAAPNTTLPPSPGGIVSLPLTHDWGPANQAILLRSFGEWEKVFGTDESAGRRAVYMAFQGEGLEGAGGASAVYVNRMASAEAAAATIALKNPAATAAISVSARYKGTRGNRFKVTASPIVEGKQTITLLDGTAELESFPLEVAETGALKNLVALINAVSPWVEAALTTEGTTGLAAGTFALATGNDGATLVGADWLAGVQAFNDVDFAYLAPFDLPWAPGTPGKTVRETISSLQAWCDEQCNAGHRFTIVFGGALEEEPTTAVSRALELKDPVVMTVGGPGLTDEVFGKLSSSQLAPRIAGIRAQRGETQNAHFARLAGTLPLPKASGSAVTLNEYEEMVGAGVIALQRDRYAAAPTRIVKDVNTWQPADRTTQNEERPRNIYGNPKMVQSMQQFANEAEQDMAVEMIGKVVVNNTTRGIIAARVLKLAQPRIKTGAFQPGVKVTPEPGSDSDDFVILKVEIAFGRALAQLFLKATVS